MKVEKGRMSWSSEMFGKAIGSSGVPVSLFDMFAQGLQGMGGLDGGALRGDLSNEVASMRGWNWTAVHLKSLQFSLAELDVFVSASLKQQIESVYGAEDASQNGSVQSAQSENVPDGYEVAHSKYLVNTLLRKPNRWLSNHVFQYQLGQHLEVFGVAYILVVPTSAGTPTEMFLIPKPMIYFWPYYNQSSAGGYRVGTLVRSGLRSYDESRPAKTFREMLARLSNRTYPAEWVIEVGLPNAMYVDDYSNPTDAMSDFIQTDWDLHSARRSLLNNQLSIGPMLRPQPGHTLDGNQREAYLAEMQARAAGVQNAGKPFWIPDGVDVDGGQYNAKEMEYNQSVDQSRDAILGNRMVSPSMIGIGNASSYAAMVASSRIFSRYAMQPLLNMVGDQITCGLARFFTAPFDEFHARYTAATIDDPQLKEQQITNDLKALCITKGEYRKARQLPEFGDERDNEIAGAPAPGAAGPGAPGMPGMPGVPGAAGGAGGAPGQPATPGVGAAVPRGELQDTGEKSAAVEQANQVAAEYVEMSRMQFQRNSKAIRDIIRDVTEGDYSPEVGVEMLQTIGIEPERAKRIIGAIAGGAANQVTEGAGDEGGGPSAFVMKGFKTSETEDQTPVPGDKVWIGSFMTGSIKRKIAAMRESLVTTGCRRSKHEPHITLLAPVSSSEPFVVAAFQRIVKSTPPVPLFFGTMDILCDGEEEAAVVVRCSGEGLEQLHRKLKQQIPNANLYPSYIPHVTVAYCKPGECEQLRGQPLPGVTGESFILTNLRMLKNGEKFSSCKLTPVTVPSSQGLF